MTTLQAGLVGYILGALATMFCVWLAGGSLYGFEETEEEDDGKKRDKNKA